MIKLKYGSLRLYVRDEILEEFDLSETRKMTLISVADVVVDTKTNTIIKCRYPIEEVLDNGVFQQ